MCFSATAAAAAVLVCIRVSKHLLRRQSRYPPPNGRNMQRNNRPDRLMQTKKKRWIKKRTAHSYLAFLISFHDSCERRLTPVALVQRRGVALFFSHKLTHTPIIITTIPSRTINDFRTARMSSKCFKEKQGNFSIFYPAKLDTNRGARLAFCSNLEMYIYIFIKLIKSCFYALKFLVFCLFSSYFFFCSTTFVLLIRTLNWITALFL